VGDYDWTDDAAEGLTIAYVRGSSLREVGDVLEFRWDTEWETTYEQALWQGIDSLAEFAWTVQVGELDGWIVVVEPNSSAAARTDTVVRLSRGGTAVCVSWNVNFDMNFVLARDGELVRRFDPLGPQVEPLGQPLPEEEGLPFGFPGEPERAALMLAERLTGIRPEREWILAAPRRTWTTKPFFPAGS
jgi:hypothetical protein